MALNETGEVIIDLLRLDDDDATRWRRMVLGSIRQAIESGDEAGIQDRLGFPEEPPNLGKRRPPAGNSRPDGVQQSWLPRRQRGELPAAY